MTTSTSESVQNRPKKHRWLGVVEDFVSLKLEEHSYQCILKHTQNLYTKLTRNRDVNGMVQKGVLPPLVAILGVEDHRDNAKLQKTAVVILKIILNEDGTRHCPATLAQKDLFTHLLGLLKLRVDSLAEEIIAVVRRLLIYDADNLYKSEPKCLKALLEAAKHSRPSVKENALSLMERGLRDLVLPSDELYFYANELKNLLNDARSETVMLTIDIYYTIAVGSEEAEEVVGTIISSGCLPLMMGILGKGKRDGSFILSAYGVVQFMEVVASKGPEYTQQLVQTGILDHLGPYLQPNSMFPDKHSHASWVTAYVISYGDKKAVRTVMERKLLPLLEVICLEEEEFNMVAFFRHLLLDNEFLKSFLENYLLAFLQRLCSSQKYSELEKLLGDFEEALREIENTERMADVRAAMLSQGPMDKLVSLQKSSDLTVQTLAQEILNFFLTD